MIQQIYESINSWEDTWRRRSVKYFFTSEGNKTLRGKQDKEQRNCSSGSFHWIGVEGIS